MWCTDWRILNEGSYGEDNHSRDHGLLVGWFWKGDLNILRSGIQVRSRWQIGNRYHNRGSGERGEGCNARRWIDIVMIASETVNGTKENTFVYLHELPLQLVTKETTPTTFFPRYMTTSPTLHITRLVNFQKLPSITMTHLHVKLWGREYIHLASTTCWTCPHSFWPSYPYMPYPSTTFLKTLSVSTSASAFTPPYMPQSP
jgi:hypothetical protein